MITALVGMAGAATQSPAAVARHLPPAETWAERGIDESLGAATGRRRVRLYLSRQLILEAAGTEQFQRLVRPRAGDAVGSPPRRVTRGEKARARRSESRFERAGVTLTDESARSAGDLRRVASLVRQTGGRVLDREVLPAAVVATTDAGSFDELLASPDVASIEPAAVEKPLLDTSVPAVGAPSWWASGLTGGTGSSDQVPADVAVQGEAPDPTHPAFADVILDIAPNEDPGVHGTHTAGIIASNDAVHRGVAFGVDRLIGADDEAYALGIADAQGPGAVDPAEVVNYSFGQDGPAEEDDGRGDDVLTALFGVGRAEAAGNSNVDGSPTVENVGRNIVSVAAYNDVDTVTSTDDVVLGISSRGPTPLGRKKPDLIAPGGQIEAPDSNWNSPPSNPDFTPMSGTSFSSPHVAGAMALLEGAGIGDPMAQRAILINSAKDWNGTNTGLIGWTGPQTGWRPEVGWGALDLTTALAQRANYELGAVPEGEAAYFRAAMPAGGKATLAFQLRGIWPNYPDDGARPITYTQSNLDLRQYTAAGAEIPPAPAFDPPMTTIDPGPDAVDPNDTVEQVRTPAAQTVTLKVEAASEVDGASAEPFAVSAASDLDPLVPPVTRPVNLEAPSGAGCNQVKSIQAQLTNDSPDLDSTSSAVTLDVPPGVILLGSTPATQTVSGGTLEPSETSEIVSWDVIATTDGPHELTITGDGQGLGTPFSRATTVDFRADCVAPETTIDRGPDGPTNDSTPSFEFSGSGDATAFQCQLDGGGTIACASGIELGPLADGPHTFSVKASDGAGNVDSTPSVRSFTVDTVAPETSIAAGPSRVTTSRSPEFLLASDSVSDFECSLDGSSFAPCGRTFAPGPLDDGEHEVRARARDDAGNVDATPVTRAFRVDTRVAGVDLSVRRSQNVSKRLRLKFKTNVREQVKVKVFGTLRIGHEILRTRTSSLRGVGEMSSVLTASPGVNRSIRRALSRDSLELTVHATFRDRGGNQARREQAVALR